MRLFTSLVLTLVLVASAPVAHAQTTEQLQQQIAQLLQQVAALQAAINAQAGSGSNTTPGTGNPSTSQSCLTITRNLGPGSEGAEVTKLQEFLAKDATIYPDGLVTGYYGSLTVAAVQRWQKRYDVVSSGTPETTGYGSVGPKTRAALAGCGDVLPSQFGGFMRVTPVAGDAPLTISVTATINTARSCDLARYTLDFGDNTAPLTLTVPAQRCSELEQVLTHTYTQPGKYTVTLGIGSHRSTVDVTVGGTGSTNNNNNNQNPSCGVAPTQPPAASCVGVWERIYDNNSCHTQWRCSGIQPLSLSPNSGAAPLTATASFDIRPGDPYEINWGDGTNKTTMGTFSDLPALSYDSVVLPQANSRVNTQHEYTKTGTFTALLKHGSYEREGNQWVWRVRQYQSTVTVSGTSVTDDLVVDDADGTAPFLATFTAHINGSGSCGAGTYTIDFGDGSSQTELSYAANTCASRTYTVTHNYTSAGTYSARMYKGTKAEVNSGDAPLVRSRTITVTGGSVANSGPFTVSAGVDGIPRKVTATFTLPSAEACNSYELKWGDNKSTVTHDSGDTSGISCTQSVLTKTFSHTYSSNGTYTLRLKRGSGELADLTSEETATVTIVSGN